MPDEIILVPRDDNAPSPERYVKVLIYDDVAVGIVVGSAPINTDFDAFVAVGAEEVLRLTSE